MRIKKINSALFLYLCIFNVGVNAATVTGTDVLDVTGSYITIASLDLSTVNVWSGGAVSYLDSYNQSTANIYNGADVSWLRMHDSSSANISDGTVSWVILSNSSSANIYNGDVSWIVIDDTSIANIYVSSYSYSINGILSGQWSDGSNFSILLKKGPYLSPLQQPPPILGTNVFVHTVPLPASIFLFFSGLTSLFLFQRIKRARAN